MDSQRITMTIEAGADILASVGNGVFRKPCPKSKRKPIGGNSGVGGRVGWTSRPVAAAAAAAAEPSARVELRGKTKAEVDRVDAVKNESSKRRKAGEVVQRFRSPTRSPMPALPYPPKHVINHAWKKVPPIPKLAVATGPATVKLTWDDGISLGSYHLYAATAGYDLFACVFVDRADSENGKWEKLTFIKALPPSHNRRQPISCEMTDIARGVEYYFAVRPMDVYDRRGPFAIVYARL